MPSAVRLLFGAALAVAYLWMPHSAEAQYSSPATQPGWEEQRFTLQLGPGFVWNVSKLDAYGPSFTLSLGYALTEHWAFAVAPTWDMEIDNTGPSSKTANTIGIAFAPAYSFNRHWSLGGGYQISFAKDDGGKWKATSEHAIGLAPAYTHFIGERWLATLGPTLGYDITGNEFSITLDLTVGFSF